jgi:glycosyltransferase involved in cell wall biosynthesis
VRIGVDATCWTNRRGFGRFTRNAVTRLVELDGENTYVLYLGSEGVLHNGLPRGAQPRLLSAARSSPAEAEASRGMIELVRAAAEVSRDHLDAFLFPAVYSYFPVASVPTLVGVHDVIAQELPALTLPSRRNRLAWRLKESMAVRRAKRVFTVSSSSRAAVARRFGIPSSRLAVVPEAADPIFHPRGVRESEAVLQRLGLEPGRFIVYAAGISPHKNVETLLRAHAGLCRRGAESPRLVVAGDLEDRSYMSAVEAIQRAIGQLGTRRHVVLPGFLPDEELASLYSAAGAVAVPSLAEGFGLPAVEAAACGSPLVLSELPAHRETLDGAALFFDPEDAGALQDRLARVLGNGDLRRRLEAQALERAGRLTWDASAERLRELVTEVARG